MIFVSLGTEKYQFNRLLIAIDRAISDGSVNLSVFAQTGTSDYKPKFFKSKDFLTFYEVSNYMRNSKIVVLHAGVGSTLLALSLGKIPIIFPRKSSLGEMVDDHQIEFSEKFDLLKKCLVAYEEGTLIHMINNYEKFASDIRNIPENIKKDNGIVKYLNTYYPLKNNRNRKIGTATIM